MIPTNAAIRTDRTNARHVFIQSLLREWFGSLQSPLQVQFPPVNKDFFPTRSVGGKKTLSLPKAPDSGEPLRETHFNPASSDRLQISANRSTPKIKARFVPRPRSEFQPD